MTAEGNDQEREALAAEYVLGTVDPPERVQAQALIVVDHLFADMVRKWERRLGELNVLIAPVQPPVATWERIKAAIAAETPRSQSPVPEIGPGPTLVPRDEAADPDVARLRRRVRRWRCVALAVTVMAAAFAAIVAVRETRPGLLPEQLQPKPVKVVEVTRTVEVPSQKPAQYVAILQKDPVSPAFLLTFDLDRKLLTVRRVAAESRPGKSYQLWLISGKFAVPRSLGIVGSDEFTEQPQLAAYDSVTINSATYAISVEPPGGSPTGVPTGPMVYSGRLVETTPPGFGGTP